MIDLECNELILQMFKCFLTEIEQHHPNNVRAYMQTIMSLILDEVANIYKQLQSNLLTIWRKKHNISPVTYDFSKGTIEQKIERFKK